MERNRSRLDLPIFDVDFISTEDDWDVFAHALQVTMPIGDIFVRYAGRDIEHDDATLSLDVITIPKTTKFLLASSVPNVKDNRPKIGGKKTMDGLRLPR